MTLELINEPSFENVGLWQLGGRARREQPASGAYDGSWVCNLISQWGVGGATESSCWQTSIGPLLYPDAVFSAWLYPDAIDAGDSANDRLECQLLWDGGAGQQTLFNERFSAFQHETWQKLEYVMPSECLGKVIQLKLIASTGSWPPTIRWANWLLDLVSIQMGVPEAMKGKATAFQRFIDLLKTIQGPPFHHMDLGGRVFNRLITPEEMPGLELPYVCCPLFEEQQSYPHFDQAVQTKWNQSLYLFTEDLKLGDRVDTTGARTISELHDDVVKAVLRDMTLGGLLNGPVNLLSCNSIAGVDDETPYAEAEMVFQKSMNFGINDLGPET